MRERIAALARTRVAGVPLPVLFIVAVLLAAFVIHRRRAKANAPGDTSSLDTSSSVGAMANGAYTGGGYSVPMPSGGSAGDTFDTTGSDFAGLTNPAATDTTVTGDPTPTVAAAGAASPQGPGPGLAERRIHPGGGPVTVHRVTPVKPAPKAAHKAAAPKKRTTVHKAAGHKPAPAVHKPAPAHKAPAHKPEPARKPPARQVPKKPSHRGGRRMVAS